MQMQMLHLILINQFSVAPRTGAWIETMNSKVKELFDYCYNSISSQEYKIKGKKKFVPQEPLTEQQILEETVNSLLYLASKKLNDDRFNKIYNYVLIPKGSNKKIKKIVDSISYLDIFNFISPGSEGFPEKTK